MRGSRVPADGRLACPYCGERVELNVGEAATEQSYVEECSVCCRPISLGAQVGFDGEVWLEASRLDD